MLSSLAMAAVIASPPKAVSLTIYNDGFALVREVREVSLGAGEQEVIVEDVAQLIEANSVSVRSLTAPTGFSVFEQNYEYDLISPQAILMKAVGGRIAFNRILPNGQRDRIEGTLISAPFAVVSNNNGQQQNTYNGMVIRTDDGRILLSPSGEIEVSSLPEGLISKPSLRWVVNTANRGRQELEFQYLTQGFGWKSDYVMTLDRAGKIGALKGWVTVTNNSGTSYANAKLSFLAGEVNRAQMPSEFDAVASRPQSPAPGAPKMEEQAFGEYHLYKMFRTSDVPDKQIKQVSLLENVGIPVRQKLVLDLGPFYQNPRASDLVGTGPLKPNVYVQFRNDEESNMGVPLPKGTFKVFQEDQDGDIQMLGESYIDHTPRNEEVSILVGQAFDVVAEAKVVDFRWLNGNRRLGSIMTIEFEVRNRKKEPTTVVVMDRKFGEFSVSGTPTPARPDANTLQWEIALQPDETKKIQYVVTTRFGLE
ncbi:MAG: DUF4139 domain-containing protein, partial [Fimbriimonadaceae bacterium]|nr:DUF4139 domain-containing protein [Fimbriimonadaceae bacterium]